MNIKQDKKKYNLILLFLLFILFASGCGTHPNNATVTNHTGSAIKNTKEETVETEEATEEPKVEQTSLELYIVENLNMTDETISLYSISDGKQYRFNYNMTTRFMDKYGKSSVWASFTPGTVVTIGDLLPSSGALSSVQKNGDVWIYEDISKYKLETEKSYITIDGSNYKILASTKIYSDTENIKLSDIGKDDVITVVGQDKTVYSIAVTTGHGFIHLTNTDLFDNSMIFIGDKIVSTVYGDETLEVPEGTYRITVANNGWGGSGEYTVERNQTTEVNLDELKGEGPSFCVITFLVTVPDTYVYLDGHLIDVTEPQNVQYGTHKLVVQCDGYESWNKTLVVNSESATITLALESDSEGTSSSDTTEPTENVEEDASTENVEEDASTENNTEENTETNPAGDTNNAAENSTEETAGSEIKDDYDYEVDYLTTISDLIGNMMN